MDSDWLSDLETLQWNEEKPQGVETDFNLRVLVIHIRLASVYIEKQWKIRALEWKNVFCVNRP